MENKSKGEKNKLSLKDIIFISVTAALVVAVIVLSVKVTTKKPKAEVQSDYYANKCAAFAVQNANLSRGQIVFIGDSITDLCPLDDYYSSLPSATYNRGISGDVTQGVYDRLKVSLYDIAPTKVVLMIGINDINGGRAVDDIAATYKKILDDIKTNLENTQVFCMSVIPLSEKLSAFGTVDLNLNNSKVVALDEKIKTLAEDHGYTYVDLYEKVSADGKLSDDLTDDGIHLNAAGFAVWSQTIKPYLV